MKIWIYLLTQAQHDQYRGLQKGQLYTSIPKIQKACAWKIGFSTVTPTKDQVFQVIDWMRKTSTTLATMEAPMIATMKATHGMLVTIDKYCVYQNSKLYESNDEPAMKATMNYDNTNKNHKNNQYSLVEANHIRLAELLRDSITAWKPNAKVDKDLGKWANVIRLCMKDGRTEAEIEAVIIWATCDSFWQVNILSADALRRNFDKLQAKMMQSKPTQSPSRDYSTIRM